MPKWPDIAARDILSPRIPNGKERRQDVWQTKRTLAIIGCGQLGQVKAYPNSSFPDTEIAAMAEQNPLMILGSVLATHLTVHFVYSHHTPLPP